MNLFTFCCTKCMCKIYMILEKKEKMQNLTMCCSKSHKSGADLSLHRIYGAEVAAYKCCGSFYGLLKLFSICFIAVFHTYQPNQNFYYFTGFYQLAALLYKCFVLRCCARVFQQNLQCTWITAVGWGLKRLRITCICVRY